MRAAELVKGRPPEDRAIMARCLQAEETSVEAILAAMRAPDIFDRVLRLCDSELMREDVVLLSANPFDAVRSDEIAEAGGFRRVGLIEAVGADEFAVNLDLALAIVPRTTLEFGFALTLSARLETEEAVKLARRLGVGPRPNRADLLIELAGLLTRREAVLPRLARLSASQRETVHEALSGGELPDDLERLALEGSPPQVALDDSEAGQLGLVFRVAQPARSEAVRRVVPLELQPVLKAWLEEVPPAPEAKQQSRPRSVRRPSPGGRGASPPPTEPTLPQLLPSRVPRAAGEPTMPVGRPSTMELPGLSMRASRQAEPAEPALTKVVRTASGAESAAWVDLEDEDSVRRVLADPRLAEGVLEVIEGRWAILAHGVDPEEWVNRCAMRLQWDAR